MVKERGLKPYLGEVCYSKFD